MTNPDAPDRSAWIGSQSIHVGVPRESIPEIGQAAREAGFDYHVVTFNPDVTLDGLYQKLSEEFSFPTPARNYQAAMDWLGDLSWIEDVPGHVIVFDGLDSLISRDYGAFRGLTDMLPYAGDRQRSNSKAFHVYLVGTEPELIEKAQFDLADANSTLAKDIGTINPSFPVEIVDHTILRSRPIIEGIDRWQITINWGYITWLTFGKEVSLTIGEHGGRLVIHLKRSFHLTTPEDQRIDLAIGNGPSSLAPILGLLWQQATRIEAFKDGHLEVHLSNGSLLSADATDIAENWDVVGVNGFIVRSAAGGPIVIAGA